jgi:hypothetical protein
MHVCEFEGKADILQEGICGIQKKMARLLLLHEEVKRGLLTVRWLNGGAVNGMIIHLGGSPVFTSTDDFWNLSEEKCRGAMAQICLFLF